MVLLEPGNKRSCYRSTPSPDHGRPVRARGPSPRARGAQRVQVGDVAAPGTIPACAGSTAVLRATAMRDRDHPRVRGEHEDDDQVQADAEGPSPRARGAPPRPTWWGRRRGTIPACAGSTSSTSSRGRPPRDHPRVRGEHLKAARGAGFRAGPSPRARGAPRRKRRRPWRRGTIPACAGSTPGRKMGDASGRDHPRVRGEHRIPAALRLATSGPSPRARGAPSMASPASSGSGTIPACAGSTRPRTQPFRGRRDHPRVRGEHTTARPASTGALGPSPRARGAQSTTCELTSGKQPFFQLLQRRTPAPQSIKAPKTTHLPPKRRLFDALLHPLFGGLLFSSCTFLGRCIRVSPSWSTGSQ